jgi:hypothetical protein
VAYRVASKARVQFARQRACERDAAASPVANGEPTCGEFQAILDEELLSMPEKYRVPILLCCLEGKSRDEAAGELGWKEGTVKIRLERGRELLRRRLARRGVAFTTVLSGTLLGANATAAALPVRLVAGLVDAGMSYAAGQSVVGVTSATAVALADGMLQTMAVARLKLVASVLLAVVLAGVGMAALGHAALGGKPQQPQQTASNRPEATPQPAEKPRATPAKQPEQPADGEKAEEPEGPILTGTLRHVHAERQSITLRVKESDSEYPLTRNAQVRIDGKEARLIDLKPSYRVRVTLTPDRRMIARAEAVGRVVSCPVQAVDVSARTVTVLLKADARTRQRTFSVDDDAVSVNGKPAQLSDLIPDMIADLQLSADDRTVLKITARSR